MDKRRQQTRARLQAALKTLLEEKELRQISIGELCATAEVTRPTFYGNFRDMPDMLDAYLSERLVEIEASYESFYEAYQGRDPRERIIASTEYSLNSFDRNDSRLRALFSNTPVILPDRRFAGLILKLIEKNNLRDVSNLPKAKRLVIAHYFSGAYLGILRLWMDQPQDISAREIAEIFADLTV